MTIDELHTTLAADIKDEYNDVIKYVNLSKAAEANDLDGPAQILKDIAHEEFTHAQHLENILRKQNALKEDNFGLVKSAREALESV